MSTEREFDEREQREWDAQERALRAERRGERAARDAAAGEYRLVVCALRTPQIDPMPADFAARVAARVAAPGHAAGERVERVIESVLVALLLLAGAAALVIYNGDALREVSLAVPENASFAVQTVVSWSLAVAACVGLSSVFAFARKR